MNNNALGTFEVKAATSSRLKGQLAFGCAALGTSICYEMNMVVGIFYM